MIDTLNPQNALNPQAAGEPNWTSGTTAQYNPPTVETVKPATPTTNPPAGHVFTTSSTAETKPVEPKAAKVDHLTLIEELVRDLHNITPSGAETVRLKIMQHIADIRDPKAYDERVAKEKKAHDESAAASKKAKEAAVKAREAEKVYVKVV